MLDPRVEAECHHLCHVLGENRKSPMTNKDRHDIFHTFRSAVSYWKEKHDDTCKKNYEGKYKAIGLFMRQYPHATVDDIKHFMLHLDQNGIEGSRDLRPK